MAIPTGKQGMKLSAKAKVNKALAIALELDAPDSVTKRLVEAFASLDAWCSKSSGTPKSAPAGDSAAVDTDLLAELEAARAENASLKGSN